MKNREPSLFRQIIAIQYEQAKRRKALRILNKQTWSVEFLEYLVQKAARTLNREVTFTVTSPAGHKLDIKAVRNWTSKLDDSDDIFNHLDDQAAVEAFIRENSRR